MTREEAEAYVNSCSHATPGGESWQIAVERAMVETPTMLASYCSSCDTWSHADKWEEGCTEDEAYAACPVCQHHFPIFDPPNKTYRWSDSGWASP